MKEIVAVLATLAVLFALGLDWRYVLISLVVWAITDPGAGR